MKLARYIGVGFAIVAALLALGCEREQRRFNEVTPAANAVRQGDLQPGAPQLQAASAGLYDGNAWAVSEGKRLYEGFNCVGCHAHGGGAIGPALMDDKWIYGSGAANIFNTIVEGRPNGMPSFRDKLTDQQVWQITAYVRSMSGQLPKDISPSRDDDMNFKTPEQSKEKEQPKPQPAQHQ